MTPRRTAAPRRPADRRSRQPDLASLQARYDPLQATTAALIRKSAQLPGRQTTAGITIGAIPVFLIEDNRLLRNGLAEMLGAQGLTVMATARSGAEALRQVARLKPELVLLDSALGDRDAVRLVEAVKQASPAIKVIVMHLLPSSEEVVAFVRAGVAGFIMKDASVADFVATIRAVADGRNILPPLMTKTLFSHVADRVLTGGKRKARAALHMTAREREVIALIGDGLSNAEIAVRLGIAPHTVKSHVHNILEKLALHTRLEVAAYARAKPGPAARRRRRPSGAA